MLYNGQTVKSKTNNFIFNTQIQKFNQHIETNEKKYEIYANF